MDKDERIKQLQDALRVFAAVADEYDNDGLDEARPDWIKRGVAKLDLKQELYSGRGGKELITLGDVLRARDVLLNQVQPLPYIDPRIAKIRAMYEAGLPNLGWEQISEERRNTIIANYDGFV